MLKLLNDGYLLRILIILYMNNQFQSLDDFKKSFNKLKETNHFNVKEIPFNELDQWGFEDNDECKTMRLVHNSGKFFKIEGIRVKTNFGSLNQWDQPIINQPEIGILGILSKKFNGIRYYLMKKILINYGLLLVLLEDSVLHMLMLKFSI